MVDSFYRRIPKAFTLDRISLRCDRGCGSPRATFPAPTHRSNFASFFLRHKSYYVAAEMTTVRRMMAPILVRLRERLGTQADAFLEHSLKAASKRRDLDGVVAEAVLDADVRGPALDLTRL